MYRAPPWRTDPISAGLSRASESPAFVRLVHKGWESTEADAHLQPIGNVSDPLAHRNVILRPVQLFTVGGALGLLSRKRLQPLHVRPKLMLQFFHAG